MNIKLDTIQKVKDFVTAIAEFESEIDVRQARYTVDGHSIMGLFSLNLNMPLETYIISSNEDEQLRFEKVVKKYEI